LKVAAVFTDYDGTIAPMGVRREESRVPEALRSRLVLLSSKIPVAVITAKDIFFVRPRTIFAWGWACAMGMEVVLADGTRHMAEPLPGIEVPLGMEKLVPQGTTVEKKLSSDGRVLGFSIDWSDGPSLSPPEVSSLVRALRSRGLHTTHEGVERFVDAFWVETDKGAALRSLRKMLGVEGAVMYLGDSSHDNDAFDLAEIAVGVGHGQRTESLRCHYVVDYARVSELLDSLLDRDLEFTRSNAEDTKGGRAR
jgi:hydroxymethylpyrimidine pyrophosphatase-like HAD family hydrolase